ncbi:cytochrome P450 [Marisediminicola antarctica]|uniref:Cytochrome n=1 Tax=Marisediminicola antarctica TaxID=674079 RepID=A0A7L5AE49_9MICO|nr:cytochrome P450 [Marisediminicola antarctica]QHO68543.1 cytochrome [Marisediminicola antarctica]
MSHTPVSTPTESPTGAAKCPVDHHGFEPFDLQDPFPAYKELRAEEPVMFDERIGYWVVTRYDDVKAVFAGWETFSSENAQAPIRPTGPPAKAVLDEGGFTAYSGLSARVPPEHTRIRKVATKAFTPRRYRVLEPMIRDNVNLAIDAMTTKMDAGTPADLVADLAWDLPTITILTLLGVPTEKIAQVKEWAMSRAAMTWGDLTDEQQVPHAHNLVKYWAFCQSLVTAAHESAGDDLVGDLVRLQAEGAEISDHEIASFCYSLLFAGHETTTTLISNTLRLLLEHPQQWAKLAGSPDAIPAAIDEVLRFSPSIVAWRRKALSDTVVGGVAIPAGSQLLLVMGSANRDADVFTDPELFDISRPDARNHLSFGFGIHYCIGNLLAKLQTRVALEEITRRLPGLRLVPGQDIEFGHNLSFRTPAAVLVDLEN